MIDPNFPLLDLHRHLDGSVRLQTILDLGRQHDLPLPSFELEVLRPHVQVTEPQPGIMAFIEKFEWMVGILVDYSACRRVAFESVKDANKEGIDYIELRFSPWFMAQAHDLDPGSVVAAVVEGVQQASSDFGIFANLIGILSRTFGPEIAMHELNALLSQKDHIVALDLAGDEANFPGTLFVDHFRIARESGWKITAHAGEASGPESIWQAINGLGAVRIGHATRAGEDPELIAYMLENRIGVEINLTSNVQTSTVSDYVSHPIKHFYESGLMVTINTDDPGISNIDITHEFNLAAPAVGLSPEDIQVIQRNALEIAFLSKTEKEFLILNKLQLSE
ncbi:MAG: adenosine deaminase [Chloroflexi bacterium]|nr:adenosine deaminase [Chloroflexota bacterium]